VRIDWRRDLQDPVRRDLLGPDSFAALLSRNGIGPDSTVVLYGGNNNWFAAYAYWYFSLYGHDRVRILDGGRKRWELDGRPLVTEVPARASVAYPVPTERVSIRAKRDAVIVSIGTADLLDVRSPDEYAGRLLAPAHLPQEQSYRPGHIPTAVNMPWSRAANDDGTFRSDDELRELYAGVGITGANPVIAYCRIGERSAHTWFVLHELLDYPDVRNYDGSWTEYGSLVGVPVQVGDEPGSALGGAA
jgi:thiosulfate/3-mercaptopyruvate sulfurtransferase